ncbi:hypothetical protein ESZ36_15290 [Colwellia demingiae]|uniref:Uncharacterized protein n=1 Tax=Colwellia demingiae TaxID=89401 RepID=A0A5C6QBM3_9GAMM|nr:hypothetical protein ESZ36_15290 [Colwellia demingiae]
MSVSYIPVPHEEARFRNPERIRIKAHFFVKGYSGEYALLRLPQRAGLETLYAVLLISTIE